MVGLIVFSPIILFFKGMERFFEWRYEKMEIVAEKKRATLKTLSDEELEVLYEKQIKTEMRRERLLGKVGKIIFWFFMAAIGAFLTWATIDMAHKIGWLKLLINVLGVVAFVSLFMGITWLMVEKSDRLKSWIGSLAAVNFIGGMISAAYTKACPLIQWQSEDKNWGEDREELEKEFFGEYDSI
jgi:predicted branched-subunit amino acid permease